MRWVFVSILWAGVSLAGEVLIDDFEGPNRLVGDVPPGPWASLDPYTAVTLTRSTAAARRGNAGLRLDDQSSMAGPGDMTALYSPPLALRQTASLRFWVRVSSSNARGSATLGQLLSDFPDQRTLCDVGVDFVTGQLTLDGADSQGVYAPTAAAATLDGGVMTLVECTVRGLGTLAGERLLHANGVRVAEQRNLDLRDAGVTTAGLGQPYSGDRRFVGTIDFDEVRVADRLQASRLWVDAGVTAFVRGQCTPVDVGFVDSEGGAQPMPWDVQLSSIVLQAQVFSDPACTSTLGAPMLVAGQTQLRFYVLPAVNSPLSIEFSFADLLGATLARPIVSAGDAGVADAGGVDAGTPDAGEIEAGEIDAGATDAGETDAGETDAGDTDAGEMDAGATGDDDAGTTGAHHTLAVGCGCSSASPIGVLALAVVLLRTRRRSVCSPR